MAEGNLLHLRLFLEGIEIPVIAASVNVAANTPASASIQVIATDKVFKLLPRTVVHLFYFDYIQSGNIALEKNVPKYEDEVDRFNEKYKLLFMGELVTLKFQKTFNSRAVILECADFSNYWDTTFQYNFNGSLFGGRRKAAFIGANSNFFTSPLGHGTGTISRLLNGRSANYPQLRGLLAGVVRMLEAIGGSYYGKNSFRGANDFTSIAELRIKVLQQITAAEEDTSTAKLFARKAFNMWMNKATGSLGKLVSFRGLVRTCFSFIFHEVYPCPVAKFVQGGTRTAKKVTSVGLKSKHASFYGKIQACLDLTNEAQENLSAWRRASRGTLGTGAGGRGQTSFATDIYVKSWAAFDKSVGSLSRQAQAMGPKKAQKDTAVLGQIASQIKWMSVNAGGTISANLKSTKEQGRSIGTLDRNYPAIQEQYKKAIKVLSRLLGIKIGISSNITVPTVSRVNNQIFRPDIWFSPPPRCNVIFPEMYDSFSFVRQYLREVSRLELQTHNEILGNDALFNGRYYAPNVEDVRRGVKLSGRRFARLIMEHELYTGIIPMFENMSEANLFAMRSGKAKKSGAKVNYAQRAVNFQYFKYRFESRGMDCSGRFNPPFIPGFPSLIIDKHMDHGQLKVSSMNLEDQSWELGIKGETTRSELLAELVSPQYLAVCAAMSHSVSQEGGRTSYQFIHARVHREDTEFLGVDQVDVGIPTGIAEKPSIVAALTSNPPKKKGRGVRGGVITNVRDVTKQYLGGYFPVLGDKRVGKAQIGTKEQFVTESRFTKDTGAEKQSIDSYRAYEITEVYTTYRKEKRNLPIEEAIRPPWIWDDWANPKVSDTYDKLFGTGAVTDVGGYNLPSTDPSSGTRVFVGTDDLEGLQKQKEGSSSSKGNKSVSSKTNDARAAALAEATKYQNAVLVQDQERTVENSVDFLVRAYSFVKVNNLDVGDFLGSYAWRPVATMVDILGGNDFSVSKVSRDAKRTVLKKKKLTKAELAKIKKQQSDADFAEFLAPDGTPAEQALALSKYRQQSVDLGKTPKAKMGYQYVTETYSKIGYEVSGKEGFHSRAFGDTEDLFGLVSPTVKRVLGLSDKKRKITAKLDVRKRRRDVVRLYVAELTKSRGLVG